MASATVTHLISTSNALSQDALNLLAGDKNPAIAYLASQGVQILYSIESAERAARQYLDQAAEYITKATANLDGARQDNGSWVTHYAAKAAEEMAKIQALAGQYTEITYVLTRAITPAAIAIPAWEDGLPAAAPTTGN